MQLLLTAGFGVLCYVLRHLNPFGIHADPAKPSPVPVPPPLPPAVPALPPLTLTWEALVEQLLKQRLAQKGHSAVLDGIDRLLHPAAPAPQPPAPTPPPVPPTPAADVRIAA